MHLAPRLEVEQKARVGPGVILLGLVIFAMAVALLTGNILCYELRQANLRRAEALSQREAELNELRRAYGERPELYARAEALGLVHADPADVEILHIRQRDPE